MKTIFIFAVIGILALCGGCLYIPYPHHAVIHRAPDEKTLLSIKEGLTSKEDILLMLGDPDIVMEQERLFQYWWQEEHGRMLVFGPGGGGGEAPIISTYSLLIYFDKNNVVRKFIIKKKGIFVSTKGNPASDKFLFELYAGIYAEIEVPNPSEIELKKNGKGVWKTLGKEIPFRWSIGDNELRLEIESGDVIGQIEDNVLEILLPADLKGRRFKRIKDSGSR